MDILQYVYTSEKIKQIKCIKYSNARFNLVITCLATSKQNTIIFSYYIINCDLNDNYYIIHLQWVKL